ncbi:transcription elongation factor GreA [Mesomycoplasma conjunctivae]|uniref:Transcription elongation factor GreA n=1 Tax=Mesomycoplasma conjunctivae (strain ATCC 25834 / NCTC 10147 / HRC/581) TaxID=572263 RepID=C5J7E4_MESCH|nr:transcription elongation factor GreA [Mesomycoplasma conjunctivae]CAT05407.1 Transcription elongation factor [Mesomycoplasma conjunctivae]VEU66632.1 transcription elongation factor GreA [Mesomycoplasma conjunctivae]
MQKNSNNQILLTKEKLEELKQELNNLINIERNNVIEEIKYARQQGDLSENAEYDAAREKQGVIESRIRELDAIITKAQIIRTNTGSSSISVGSKVTIENLKNNKINTFQIVGSSIDADPFQNKISISSAFAQAIMGQHEGDELDVDTIEKYSVRILKVENN